MPLPEPKNQEQEQDFIDRCMTDVESSKEFPDASQRRAVCQSLWDEKTFAETNSDDVSKRVEKSLEKKLEVHREKVGDDKRKQTTLRKLKIVYNRGVGAYRTNPSSVRPSVGSPEQWAQGRVNSFLFALRNLKYKSGKHDTDLLPKEHPMAPEEKKAADSHRRYQDGEPIPSALPPKYRKSRSGGETAGQACINCKFYKEDHKDHRFYCTKWEAPIRPQYWCAAWKALKEEFQETYNDYPESATNNAKRALKYKSENPDNKCGTLVGWARANQLAKREKISRDTIARMASFKRHQQNKDVPYDEGCGGLMWDAWGGTSGVEWAINKLKQIDKKKNSKMNKQFAFGIASIEQSKIDKENGTMSGVSLISVGPALGHGLFVDDRSLDTIIAELEDVRLPAYITHRGALFDDRLTREIGMFDNFRLEDGRVLGDFQAFESFREDDARKYNRLFELAEKMPERFGLSIVFSATSAWATDAGDVETNEKPEDALFEFPSIRVEEVSSADFVDNPAANQRGLFSNIDSKPTYKMTKLELSEKNESLETALSELQEQNTQLALDKADIEATAEGLNEQLGGHEEEMKELQEKLDAALEQIESLTSKLQEKEEELAAKDEEMTSKEEELKEHEEEKEMIEVEASKKEAKIETLEKLIEGSEPLSAATDSEVYKPSKVHRDKIISEFAKEHNISEFTATLRLSKTKPELFNS